jgi:hypothetical protein
MAVKDIRSDLKQTLALLATIASNTTTAGAIIDTANFELGLMFAVQLSAWTDGTYTLLLEESDADDMTGAVAITGDKLIGDLPVLSAATVEGAVLPTVGVISNLRYVRASLVSAGVTTGATAQVIATEKGEELAVI